MKTLLWVASILGVLFLAGMVIFMVMYFKEKKETEKKTAPKKTDSTATPDMATNASASSEKVSQALARTGLKMYGN